ncbi:MAG: hypothetical protein FJ399_21650, partial [Verrucomicrobia bacterium]|nr:hypothetical protein [Verrucomicrobiota bacterium]
MKLQTKLLLTILGGVIAVYLGSQAWQQTYNSRLMRERAEQNLAKVEATNWAWIEGLVRSTQASLVDAMTTGEMARFRELLAAQREVKQLRNIALFDYKGVVRDSLDRGRLKSTLDPAVRQELAGSGTAVKRRTTDTYLIYQPLPVTAACLECHNELKGQSLGGVIGFEYRADAAVEAKAQWTDFVGEMSRSAQRNALLTAGLLIGVIAILVVWSVRKQVARPLASIAGTLTEAAEQNGATADTLSSASRSLAEGATAQAAALEESSASLEELAGMTKRNAENGEAAKTFATEMRHAADAGAADMEAMRRAMEAIKGSAEEISRIVKLIDEIAFQTNLLALNAAVEAARAGAAGAGFAVVAGEVRNLARRSAESARETAARIEESVENSNRGGEICGRVAHALAEIVGKARKVDNVVAEIAQASREQHEGVTQIRTAVARMETVTQANAAGAEESSAAAEELAAQAGRQRETVATLVALVHGRAAAAPAPAEQQSQDIPMKSPARMPGEVARRLPPTG